MAHIDLPVSLIVQTDTSTGKEKFIPVTLIGRMLMDNTGNTSDRPKPLSNFTLLAAHSVYNFF